nr:hypothetical protein [Tanacetum cinerariifolium]
MTRIILSDTVENCGRDSWEDIVFIEYIAVCGFNEEVGYIVLFEVGWIPKIGNYSLRNKNKGFERYGLLPDTLLEKARREKDSESRSQDLIAIGETMKLSNDAEISNIKKDRLLLKSVIQTNPKHARGWIAAPLLEEVARMIRKYDMVFDKEAGANSPRKKQQRHHDLLSVDAYVINLVVAQEACRGGNEDGIRYTFQLSLKSMKESELDCGLEIVSFIITGVSITVLW